jgi:N-terminal domain of reverse transcriptase
MLSRSGQNGTWSGPGAANSPGADVAPPAKSGGPTHLGTSTERGKPVVLPPGDSDSREELTGRRVKDGGGSECRPVTGRIGVEPKGDITPPERAPTSLGSSLTREPRPTDSGSNADMTRAATPAGAAPGCAPEWNSIHWGKVWRVVRRLQARIVKAVRAGRWNKVKALVYLLTHSYSGRATAILRVVSNSGARTPGVDGILWNTPESKSAAFVALRRHGYRPRPLLSGDSNSDPLGPVPTPTSCMAPCHRFLRSGAGSGPRFTSGSRRSGSGSVSANRERINPLRRFSRRR